MIDTIIQGSAPLISKAVHNPGKPSLVSSLWQEVCRQEIRPDEILFDLGRRYRDSRDGCSAFLAYMQALSNGGAATALRRYCTVDFVVAVAVTTSGGAATSMPLRLYNISDEEWLGGAAACAGRTL